MIDKVKQSIAKLKCGNAQGTAFLVDKNTALTAAHCIIEAIEDDKDILLSFYNIEGREPFTVKANYVQDEDEPPVSVLRLDAPVEIESIGIACYIDHIERGRNLFSYGYPKIYGQEGYPIDLSVNQYMNSSYPYDYDIAVLIDEKSRVNDYSGMSGSPVCFEEHIIGILLEEGIEVLNEKYHATDLKMISNMKMITIFEKNKFSIEKLYFQELNEENDSYHISMKTLPVTLKNRDFDIVFEEVGQATLGLTNPEDLRIFRLKIEDYNFSYVTLQKFLNSNIGRYVYSRAKMEQYRIKDDIESIGIEAAQYLRAHRTDNELGEMLLYSFLEEVLHAPKLFSKAELGNITGNCDGIHIQTMTDTIPSYQMVFGTSDIQGKLSMAIDTAFDAVVKLKSEKPDNMMLVESTIFNCAFENSETTEKIKSILLPNKANQDFPSTAFGLFVGYTIDVEDDDYMLPISDFRNKMNDKLQADIIEQSIYISNKIKELHLGCHSFYIYIFPLNDADKDKIDIINKLIGGAAS